MLFISKLLPLFIYPLGLSCLLLIITLILWWKSPRFVPIPIALALIVLLLAGNGWISNAIVQSLEWQNIPQELPNADAIVLLGGATKSANSPRPMVDINEQGDRVNYAAKLYRDGKAPLIIAAGGRVAWRGGGRSEATDMAELLMTMGVPNNAIEQETESLNTYENAVNVKPILEAKSLQKVILVTSALHMPRSLAIFKKQKIDVIAAPTDFMVSEQEIAEPNASLEAFILNLLPDADRLEKTTKAIKEYIGILIYRLKGWV
jgi:uncharacterized SAM-binding protein YcdF (DUF218 family)